MTTTIIARRGFVALYREERENMFGGITTTYFVANDGCGVSGTRLFDSDEDAIAWFKTFKF